MSSCDKETDTSNNSNNEITEEHTLTIIVNPSGGGTTSPAVGSHDYDDGTEINITATAADGYVFDHWSGDVEKTTTSASITMTSNRSITANFALAYDLTVNVDSVEAGEVTLSEEGPYKEDMEVTLTAIPADGYVFSHWSGDASGYTEQVTIIMDSYKNITANFNATIWYDLTVIVKPDEGGTVDIDPLMDSYEPGSEVELTVSLNSDSYLFLGWKMDDFLFQYDKSITIFMDSDKTITALIQC